jgi:hypothetical protein
MSAGMSRGDGKCDGRIMILQRSPFLGDDGLPVEEYLFMIGVWLAIFFV